MDPYNAEFVRLFSASGFSGAEVARRLGLDASSISQYRSGTTRPSMTVLRLFSRLLRKPLLLPGESGEVSQAIDDGPRPLETWEEDVIAAINSLPVAKRDRVVEAIKTLLEASSDEVSPSSQTSVPIRSLRAKITKGMFPGTSPTVEEAAAASLVVSEELLQSGGLSSKPLPGVAEPTANTIAPTHGTSRRTGSRQSVPGSAQAARAHAGASIDRKSASGHSHAGKNH